MPADGHSFTPRIEPGDPIRIAPVEMRGLNPRKLDRAFAFIHAHLGEHLTLQDLARTVCISRFHFARLFRLSTGLSPMAFLLRARVERACEMLRSDARNIADTAAALGFFDQSHFTRTFRRFTGRTPREFVRTHAPTASSPAIAPTIRSARTRGRADRFRRAGGEHNANVSDWDSIVPGHDTA